VSHRSISGIAGPVAIAVGAVLLVQQLVMASFLDRSQIEATMASPIYLPCAITYFLAFCGLLIALIAVYEREASEAGAFGVAAFVAAVIGTTFLAGDLWFEAFAVPWLGDVAPAALHQVGGTLMVGAFTGYVLFAAGWVLFGIASLRARVFPVAISVAIIIGGAIGFQAALPPFAVPLALAVGSLGIWLVRVPAIRTREAALAAS